MTVSPVYLVPERVLVNIHKHLRYAFVLLGPGARATREHIDRAQEELDSWLGRRPMLLEGESPARPALDHLLEANALAGEHLGSGRRARKVRRCIRGALSEARREAHRL